SPSAAAFSRWPAGAAACPAAPGCGSARWTVSCGGPHAASAHRAEQGLEHLVGGLDDLRGGLVGLLVTQQVGSLLVEVDARHRLALGNHLRVDRALRLEAEVGVARLAAGAAGELGQARGQADAAAVEDAVGVDRSQRARIAVVGRTRRSGYEAEAVAGRGRAGKLERPAVAAHRRARGPRIRPVAVNRVLGGIDELDARPRKAGERG